MTKKEEISGALIGLARTCNMHPKTEETTGVILCGLMAAHPYADSAQEELRDMLVKIEQEKKQIAPGCAACMARCGNTDNYDLDQIQSEEEEIRCLKTALLQKLYDKAIEAVDSYMQGSLSEEEEMWFYRALCAVSYDMDADRYQSLIDN